MQTVHSCVETLLPFIQSVISSDWTQAKQIQKDIINLEKEADIIKRDVRLHLPKGLFLPVSRNDVLNILRYQDKLANKAKDIAGLMVGRKMELPKTIETYYIQLLVRVLDASKQARRAIYELDELLETGFRGRELELVEEMIDELDEIEHHTDELQADLRHELFKIEKNLPPVDVVFLYQVIQWTGDLADQAQIVGGQLQSLLAK